MKSLDEYYQQKLYEDNLEVVFNSKEYTIGNSSAKATADRIYDNIFNDIKNDSVLYNYIVKSTDNSFDKKFVEKRFDPLFKLEMLKRYVAFYNYCDMYNRKGDMVNLNRSLDNLKFIISTLKDFKVWK